MKVTVIEKIIKVKNKKSPGWCGSVDGVECWPVNGKVTGLIPGRDTCLGCGPGPYLEPCERHVKGSQSMYLSHIDVSLRLFLPSFPSL